MFEMTTELRSNPIRLLWIVVALGCLALVYLFQESLALSQFTSRVVNPDAAFIFKKTLRVVLNDSFTLLFIYAWFNNVRITRVAMWLQLIDTLVLLPIYLFLKLSLEGDSEISSPLLSQLHRLIVNPTLMVLFIPAVYFQQLSKPSANK